MISAFTLNVRLDNIVVITIDVPGEKMNALKAELASQVRTIIKQFHENKDLRGMVFISVKPNSFIAGADINMIASCKTVQEAKVLARQGQQLMAEIHTLPVPIIAAVRGARLGGGLELTLTCHSRVRTDDPKTVLGLPEVQLGSLPDSGDIQCLPRLIDVSTVLEMILTGKQLRTKQALKLGLADDVVLYSILLEVAVELTKQDRPSSRPLSIRERIPAGSLDRALPFKIVGKKIEQKTRGNYPVTKCVLNVIETDLAQGTSSGYDVEVQAFGRLVMAPQSQVLRNIFFASTGVKRDPGSDASPVPLNSVGILDGDLMGGGIAYIIACKAGLPTRVKGTNPQGINHALKYGWDQLEDKVCRRHLKASECDKQLALISGTMDYRGFAHCGLTIEVVFGSLGLKQQMVAEVEQNCATYTIFISNTSSLPIADIATYAARPEQAIGLHFFSPVEKMPLVEIIPHTGTSARAIATIVKLAKKQGKTPIVVCGKAGFYVDRILMSYISEAIHMLTEGEQVGHIDVVLAGSGFPVGPTQPLDEVGINTRTKIIPVLRVAYGERFSAPANVVSSILNGDRKGRKSGRGFYLYSQKERKSRKQVDPAIHPLIGAQGQERLSAPQVAEQCMMLVLNEAIRCLSKRVIHSVCDRDIGAVFGIGFPPPLDRPFRYIDFLGTSEVTAIMQRLVT